MIASLSFLDRSGASSTTSAVSRTAVHDMEVDSCLASAGVMRISNVSSTDIGSTNPLRDLLASP